VSLAADVSGNLPPTNLNSGTGATNLTFWRGDGTWATPSGSGTVNPAPQFSIGYYPNAGSANVIGGVAAPTAPNGLSYYLIETPAAGAATTETFAPAGVPGRTVSACPDTITYLDRANLLTYTPNTACAITLPQAGSANFQFNFVIVIRYTGTNILTLTPTTSTINGAATLLMGQNDYCFIYSIDNANYLANCSHGNGTMPVVADTGAVNAYVVSYPLVQSLQTGAVVAFTTTNTNTSASTINVNGLGVKNLLKANTVALVANDILPSTIYFAVYDGTAWEVLDPSTSVFGLYTAHNFFGNNTGSSKAPSASLIGSSDTTINWYATDSGGIANTYVVAPTPAVTALTIGATVTFSTANANTGASTLQVSGLASKSLTKKGAAALVSGDILATPAMYFAIYDGTQWELLNPSSGAGGTGTVNNCTILNALGWFSATGTAISCLGESDASQYQYAADTGAANAYVITLAPPLASLQNGDIVTFKTSNPNTGASTINVSALTVKNITKFGTVPLVAGDIRSGALYILEWDGTEWQLMNPSTPTIGSSNVTAQSTSQSAVTLATAPAAGSYTIRYYAAQNAVCTTGANSVSFTFNWTDAGNARSLTTGSLLLGSAQATSGYLSGLMPIFVNSGNVTYTSTVAGACATGTSSYDVRASIERTQ
jgi:hypothetical protein